MIRILAVAGAVAMGCVATARAAVTIGFDDTTDLLTSVGGGAVLFDQDGFLATATGPLAFFVDGSLEPNAQSDFLDARGLGGGVEITAAGNAFDLVSFRAAAPRFSASDLTIEFERADGTVGTRSLTADGIADGGFQLFDGLTGIVRVAFVNLGGDLNSSVFLDDIVLSRTDAAAVPVPASAVLMGPLALGVIARRRRGRRG